MDPVDAYLEIRRTAAQPEPPDDSTLLLGSGQWWNIHGVKRDATKEEIRSAFRALAKIHHTDAGTDMEDFKRLRLAYEEGMRAIAQQRAGTEIDWG